MNEKNKIYLDTFVFMDLLSGDAIAEKALLYIEYAKKNGAIVSVAVLAELAYHLRRRKSREKTEEILSYIKSIPGLEIVPMTEEIARLSGIIRAKYKRLKLEKKFTYFDCVHIATALTFKCSKIVTGDRGFKDIKEIEVEIY